MKKQHKHNNIKQQLQQNSGLFTTCLFNKREEINEHGRSRNVKKYVLTRRCTLYLYIRAQYLRHVSPIMFTQTGACSPIICVSITIDL